jgi:hypothetical protein
MKYFLKYSFLFICIFCFLTVGNTQQKNKKKAKGPTDKERSEARIEKMEETKAE